MALDVEVGVFTKDSSGSDGTEQNVSVGFTPKVLIIWGSKLATTNADAANSSNMSFGFVDDADINRCINSFSQDGTSNADSRKMQSETYAVVFTDLNGLVEVQGIANLETNNLEFVWTLANTDATLMHYIIYGGDDITGVQALTLQQQSGTPPFTHNVTTDADCQNISNNEGVVFVINCSFNTLDTRANDACFNIGIATTPTERSHFGFSADRGTTAQEPHTTFYDDAFLVQPVSNSTVITKEADFGGFTATGFDMDYAVNLTGTMKHFILIIKGGQWQTGTETTKVTSTGTQATTTLFEPKALFSVGSLRTTVTTTNVQASYSYNIGATDGTNEFSNSVTEENATATMNTGIMSSATKSVRVLEPTDQSVLAEANFDSFNATDFTLDFTTINGSEPHKFAWLVCGDSSLGFAHSQGYVIG